MEIRKPNSTCSTCQKEVYKRPREIANAKRGLYCSKACYGIAQRIEHPCVVCQNPIQSGANKQTCSKECAKANYNRLDRIHAVGRPKIPRSTFSSRSFRKRFIGKRGNKCELCPYSIAEVLNIHHIKERKNGGTDEETNLIVICPNCHTEVHRGLRKIESCKSGNYLAC